jgi:hypothetical protein
MSEFKNSSALPWILGGALVLIGLFVLIALVSVRSQADSVTTTTTVTNSNPVVDSVYVNDASGTYTSGTYNSGTTPITLTAGTTKTVYVSGKVTDANGVGSSYATGDLNDIKAEVYSSATTSACTADNNNCYRVTGCTIAAATATQVNYDCQFALQYYADSSSAGGPNSANTWQVTVTATDDATATGASTITTPEIGTLLALSIPATINYGTLTRAEKTTNSTNQAMTITQYGNDSADVEVSGTAMSCSTIGDIAIGDQEWALTDLSHSAGGSTNLTGSAVDTNFGIAYRTNDGAALTKDLYWNVEMPVAVSGTCTGTNTITAIAS